MIAELMPTYSNIFFVFVAGRRVDLWKCRGGREHVTLRLLRSLVLWFHLAARRQVRLHAACPQIWKGFNFPCRVRLFGKRCPGVLSHFPSASRGDLICSSFADPCVSRIPSKTVSANGGGTARVKQPQVVAKKPGVVQPLPEARL